MGRAPCCDKAKVKKGPWSPEEDAKLKSHIQIHGTGGNWISLPNKIGLKRCGKSCRLRWLNYLRPNLKHGGFTQDEDNLICTLYLTIGTRWSVIAAQLPGRTDNDIKNYWNTKLKKKLFANQRSSAPSPPPPPPPPSVSLSNIYGSCTYNYVMEAGGQVQWENSVVPSPVEMGMYDAAPVTTATSSSSSSSSIENLSWEDINSLQFPHATNYQPWLLLDEPRLLTIKHHLY